MRVAIVGANLLGCASSYYIREALDGNRNQIESESEHEDQITIFDKLPCAGGHKFAVASIAATQVPIGTASGVDVNSASVLKKLVQDTGIPLPSKKPQREWAIYDWNRDEYILDKTRSKILTAASESSIICTMLQLFALLTCLIFAKQLYKVGLEAFISIGRRRTRYIHYPRIIWFASSAILAFGIFPMKWVLRAYNWLIFRFYVDVVSNMTFGGRSTSSMGVIATQLRKNLDLIVETGSSTSCITLGHFVNSCGMSTLVRSSASEYLGKYQVRQNVLDHCVAPGMAQTYGDSRCTPDHNSSALSTMLNILVRSPIPTNLRSRSLFFDAEQTKNLCPKIAEVSRAKLQLDTEVTAVKLVSKGVYDVRGVDNEGKDISLGEFDAVILAAVVDPKSFIIDSIEGELESVLALKEDASMNEQGVNSAKYVSLVKGEMKCSFVKRSCADDVATHVSILNSVNCSEILRVGEDLYRISSNEEVKDGAAVTETVFDSMMECVGVERETTRYRNKPLRVLDGTESPQLILDTRFLNAACTDRLGNDVNIDCLSAINIGSLFKQGVADWK